MINIEDTICRITGAKSCKLEAEIQVLWSGYGAIQRVATDLPAHPTLIVKHIDFSQSRSNRAGWSGDISHQRKIRSYQVEKSFYESFASQCMSSCRIPKFVAASETENESSLILVMEDLDAAGFGLRKNRVTMPDVHACLRWLASFHATFLGCRPKELWPIGTYWHLDTRPDEWTAMKPGSLKNVAAKIDARLNAANYQTLVHGDAKLANFCFSNDSPVSVAAVDFQYVGGGCGMKDVAYFISSCLDENESGAQQDGLLDYYFENLRQSLSNSHPNIDFDSLEQEWRELFPFAWADFCRFLAGWSPGHWKLNQYNDQITKSVVEQLS